MSLTIVNPGMQASLQSTARRHQRHQGVPASGAADVHSLQLANLTLGNANNEACIEITGGNFEAVFKKPIHFALAGAPCPAFLNAQSISFYEPIKANAGDKLVLEHPTIGLRTYLAVTGAFTADMFLGNTSTYMPANLGGHFGRALRAGDPIAFARHSLNSSPRKIPETLHPFMANHWLLRVCKGQEFDLLTPDSQKQCFSQNFTASSRLSRMGIQLDTPALGLNSDGHMKSEPVFPGTIQCPENGKPFILLADAQTTGGYPRIAQVVSADRHRLGQIRPNDKITFVESTPSEAQEVLSRQTAALASFLKN